MPAVPARVQRALAPPPSTAWTFVVAVRPDALATYSNPTPASGGAHDTPPATPRGSPSAAVASTIRPPSSRPAVS
jgi:hypothetical protein